MKTTLFLSILFCAIALPALGDLTDTDLNRIRLILNEEIKKESAITNQKIDALDDRIQNVVKDVAWIKGKPESVDKQIPHAKYVLYGLIVIIAAVVVTPLILVVQEIRNDRSLKKRIKMLIQEIEMLKQQTETLKQQRIVNP